ncbi:glutathione peroxidase [Paenibacillus contaminans]|uniref:Glutathione peroxidase n=1 Tax=Paenibacillus contaminans TaxID=450362 RepID=A0A329LXJ2_9BACL|nr:glutathione peroxidase [Paenibacillus contaminans]RAV11920.1 glutathione peroxidase [Paenibacillus contaminans]
MSVYGYSVKTIKGEEQSLSAYENKVLLIVNTATKCGFAPQFTGLQKLHDAYKDKGFSVLGFPCNQFRDQEPGSNEDIQSACSLNFGVNFPLFAKIDVNGPNAHPLYDYLKRQKGGVLFSGIKWNFTKFLVDRSGNVVKRYSPTTSPDKIEADVRRLLQDGGQAK